MARLSALLGVSLSIVTVGVAPSAHAQPICEAPRVLLVVDRSSSMVNGGELPGGGTKWQVARTAIGEVTAAFADRIDFGLAVYPAVDGMNTCEPGRVTVEVGMTSSEAILAGLGGVPPRLGNWTPTSQTLAVLTDYAPMLDDMRDRHVVLITDGEQCCFPAGSSECDASERFHPIDRVMELASLGMKVHVVGFGAQVDPLTLNRSAVAGGTALPGCDASSEDAASENNCYLQADDLTELRAALDSIGRLVTDEMCDGYDNDCNGTIDDGYDRDTDGFTICGSDPGTPGIPLDDRRIDCDDADGDVFPGAEEVCDGIDNDCDGTTDPGCACLPGEMERCGMEIGECASGRQLCTDEGGWGRCEDAVEPAASDLCDGRDEDCDGMTDEGAACPFGGVCHEGACVDPVPPAPVPMKGGCGCTVPGEERGPLPIAATLLLAGLVALRLRRRR